MSKTGYQQLQLYSWVKDFLPAEIPLYPLHRYVHIFILRETKSHAIFTTEGGVLDVERVQAGLSTTGSIDRVLMFKRKQIAPERRTGRALLRDAGLLEQQPGKGRGRGAKKAAVACRMMDAMCGRCPDCVLYGFAAVSGTGAQKARVLTDSAFSVRAYQDIQKNIKLNAISDSTAGGVAGSAFSEKDHLLPQVILPCVETLLDVTPAELIYVLQNILFTTRYGAEANREGFVRNHIVAIATARSEVLSNLELTQLYYDLLSQDGRAGLASGYLEMDDFLRHLPAVVKHIQDSAWGGMQLWSGADLATALAELRQIFNNEKAAGAFWQELAGQAAAYADKRGGGNGEAAGEQE